MLNLNTPEYFDNLRDDDYLLHGDVEANSYVRFEADEGYLYFLSFFEGSSLITVM